MWYRMNMRCEKEKIMWELDLLVDPECVQFETQENWQIQLAIVLLKTEN